MLDNTRSEYVKIWRSGEVVGNARAELFAPDRASLRLAFVNGIKLDIQGYVEKNADLRIHDVIERADGTKYKLFSIVAFSTFLFIEGERIENT